MSGFYQTGQADRPVCPSLFPVSGKANGLPGLFGKAGGPFVGNDGVVIFFVHGAQIANGLVLPQIAITSDEAGQNAVDGRIIPDMPGAVGARFLKSLALGGQRRFQSGQNVVASGIKVGIFDRIVRFAEQGQQILGILEAFFRVISQPVVFSRNPAIRFSDCTFLYLKRSASIFSRWANMTS